MSFQGSLDTVGLEDVFQLFSFSRKSGALRLELDEDRGAVYFHEGEVYYATTNPTEGIGKGLVNAGVISSDDWKAVLARTRGNDVSQGKALIEQSGVDTALVEAYVRERVEDAVFKLLQWESGDFALHDEVHPLGPVFVFASEPLLNEGRRRLDIWNEIRDAIPSTAMGVGLRRDVGADVEAVTLDREEWRVVATLTPGVSIEELSAALGDTEYATCRVLHRMLERDILELHSPEKLEVIRRLMASAQSLDTEPGEDLPGPEDVSDVDEAVAEVVVEQTEEVGPPAGDTSQASVGEAPAEAAAAVVETGVAAAYDAGTTEAGGDVQGEPAESDTEPPENEGASKVSLADLAAAVDDDGEAPAQEDQSVLGVGEADSHAAVPESVTEAAEAWQHTAPAAEVPTHYEYQAPGTETAPDPHSFPPSPEQGIVESAVPAVPGMEAEAGSVGGFEAEANGAEPTGDDHAGGVGEGGEELDKGLILRLIAGVRSL